MFATDDHVVQAGLTNSFLLISKKTQPLQLSVEILSPLCGSSTSGTEYEPPRETCGHSVALSNEPGFMRGCRERNFQIVLRARDISICKMIATI